MKVTIKETAWYRLVMKKTPCVAPAGLNNIEFVGEKLKDGEVTDSSTYQFFMTQPELDTLAKAITE
jgi:hypothetical protein